jgi:hypothetical protein
MADKMRGRAGQTASSILGAIYHAPPTRQGCRRYALQQVCYILPLARYPGALLWSLVDHLEAQRRPPAPSPPTL